MQKTIFITIIALTWCLAASGVSPEIPDSLRTEYARPDTSFSPVFHHEIPSSSPAPPLQRLDSRYLEDMKDRAVAPLFSTSDIRPAVPGTASIVSMHGLDITASGASRSLPGLAGTESGRIAASAMLGPLTFTAWGAAEKYGYFRGLQTIYGFGGTVNYRLTPRLSLTAFGSYYTAATPVNPAIGGMMSMTTVGGYASYDLSEHWGVSVGAEATRSIFDRRWHAQPIVMPYYKVNENVSIGANIGGIAYGLLQNYIDSRNARHHRVPAGPPAPRPRR